MASGNNLHSLDDDHHRRPRIWLVASPDVCKLMRVGVTISDNNGMSGENF